MEKLVTVIYSPVCEQSGRFLGELEEWIAGRKITIRAIPFDQITDREREWYRAIGKIDQHGHIKRTVFIDVFYDGNLIDSVPLKRERIERALGLEIQNLLKRKPDRPGTSLSFAEFRKRLVTDEIVWSVIGPTNFHDEMRLCLDNYPYGNPARRFHAECIAIKEPIFRDVFTRERIAGVFAAWQEQVIGLLEVFPREILKKYGYVTGTTGADEQYLTVGCFEVGAGVPRREMIDALMYQLEAVYPQFQRSFVEGVGRVEWNEGFTPYWVYDKYGFSRKEVINESTVIMEKRIHGREQNNL